MSQSATIKLVEGSALSSITLDECKSLLMKYKEQLALTGKQLGWDYEDSGFPYTVETKPEGGDKWFYLKAKDPKYRYIVVGIGSEGEAEGTRNFIQIVLPEGATYGDKSKGNELSKHLAKTLKAELHMFNGRVMYFNPRK